MVEIGSQAPAFSLPNQNGDIHSLENYAGTWLLIYFYPEDDTPGCTTEACNFRDVIHEFEKNGCMVIGISKDSVASHQKFAEKYKLPFTILSDETGKTVEEYGAWQEKTRNGKTAMDIARMSVLIDPNGTIVKVYPKAVPEEHAAEVLRDVQEFIGEAM